MVNPEDRDDKKAYLPSQAEIRAELGKLRPKKEAKAAVKLERAIIKKAKAAGQTGGRVFYLHHHWNREGIVRVRN